tara:strand:+ start:4018 stop:4701 length:684 start_codon:yes stop_codon:yes gene_type:complete
MLFNTNNIKYDDNPFDHWLIEDFLNVEDARNVSKEFIDYDNPTEDIIHYQGWIAEKKTCNRWDRFPPLTYRIFSNLLSVDFVSHLSTLTGISPLYPDIGLHGGGWHMHGKSGNLAMHLDYSIHPKLNLQRKLNLIVYLEEDYDPEWGGSLQFWSHDKRKKKPLDKIKEIEPLFNRAILFDTTQHSWHGFPEPINPPQGKMRKSFAVYYMTDITETAEERYRARYVGV